MSDAAGLPGVGTLFVVATPIGNLEDLSPRARRVLSEVAVIAAEDTRHSGRLLSHFGIATARLALHDHNETAVTPRLIERLLAGESVALISDAGTPLLSDPGFVLVRAARAQGIATVAVPGPSAVTAALSVSGLPTDRFVFEGFLPAKSAARQRRLVELRNEPRTLVVFESPHRIRRSLEDLVTVLGGQRPAAVTRELTKIHEEVLSATLAELAERIAADADRRRGEFVLVIGGAPEPAPDDAPTIDVDRLLGLLVRDLPVKRAAAIAAELVGGRRNNLYRRALALAKR